MLKEFYRFISDPRFARLKKESFSFKTGYLLQFYIGLYLLVFMAALISRLTCNFVFLNDGTDLLTHYKQNFRSVPGTFGMNSLFFGLLFAPLSEELVFRFPLYLNRNNLLICTCALLALLSFNLIEFSTHFSFQKCELPAIGFLLLGVNYTAKKIFPVNGFRFTVYLSCLVFGFLHLWNYQPLSGLSLLVSPLIVLPILISGFGFSYIRLKFGFFWGLALHILMNLVPVISLYLST